METNTPNTNPPEQNPRKTDSGVSIIMIAVIAITLIFVVPMAALIWFGTRLVEGELVLSPAGGKALEYHGAQIDYLDGDSLCAIRTKFRISLRETSGRVLVQTEHGSFVVELSGAEVVSKAYR